MPIGTSYQYGYNHKRKEVIFIIRVGSAQPIEIVLGAEAFIQDLDFIKNDTRLTSFIESLRRAKDLPIDHDFKSDTSFEDEWNKLMDGEQ